MTIAMTRRGVVNRELRAAVLAELLVGGTSSEIGRRLNVTKNAVMGHKARAGLCVPAEPKIAVLTMFERLDALAAKIDAVLDATRPVLAADRARWRHIEAQRVAAKLAAKRAAA